MMPCHLLKNYSMKSLMKKNEYHTYRCWSLVICIGDAIIVNKDNINYSPSYIRKSQVKDEIKKFEKALSRLRQEYQKSKQNKK